MLKLIFPVPIEQNSDLNLVESGASKLFESENNSAFQVVTINKLQLLAHCN